MDITLISKSLLLDLETTQQGKILKNAAVFANKTFLKTGHFDLKIALSELDGFSARADCVVGHNLIQHDLSVLSEVLPVLNRLLLQTKQPSGLLFSNFHRILMSDLIRYLGD